jgi:hypothetical protein
MITVSMIVRNNPIAFERRFLWVRVLYTLPGFGLDC